MSADHDNTPVYNPLAIKAWSILSGLVALLIFGMLIFGPSLLTAGKAVWDLIRWLAYIAGII